MDASNNKFLNKIDIITRIKYYLGPLYYKDKVYVENLVGIEDLSSSEICAKRRPACSFQIKELKNMLLKYNFQDKKFLYDSADIQHVIDEYYLVKNRWLNKNKINNSILLLHLYSFHRDWNHFYSIHDNIPFDNKINKIVWRGSTTGNPNRSANRFTLVTKYFNKYKDIDIAFSNIVQNRDVYKKYLKNSYTIPELLQYKYIISVHGNDKDSGLNWKLASNSLVLMHKPYAVSWLMEDKLIPNYHYILLKDDFSDLIEKFNWCNKHPREVQQIIKNANEYMDIFSNIKEQEYIERKVLELYFKKINHKISEESAQEAAEVLNLGEADR